MKIINNFKLQIALTVLKQEKLKPFICASGRKFFFRFSFWEIEVDKVKKA